MSEQDLAPAMDTQLQDPTMLQQARQCSACGMRMSYIGGLRGFGLLERRHAARCLLRAAQHVVEDRSGMPATLLTSFASAEGKTNWNGSLSNAGKTSSLVAPCTVASGIALASEVVGRVVGKVLAKQSGADTALASEVLARAVAKVVARQNDTVASKLLQPSLRTHSRIVATADAATTSGESSAIEAKVVAGEALENSRPSRKTSEDRRGWSPRTPGPTVAPTGNATLELVDNSEVDVTAVRRKWENRAAQQQLEADVPMGPQQCPNRCTKARMDVNVRNTAAKQLEIIPFCTFQYTWELHVQTPLPTHLQNEQKRLGIDEHEWQIRLSVTDSEGFFLDVLDPLHEAQFPAGVSWEEAPGRRD